MRGWLDDEGNCCEVKGMENNVHPSENFLQDTNRKKEMSFHEEKVGNLKWKVKF